MKGFQHLYNTGGRLKISYAILILIIIGIGFYFVSMPKLQNEPATTIQKETITIETTTTIPIIFIPSSEAEHKLVMFTSVTPMWEFSLQENSFISSPEDGNVKVLAANIFLVASDEWIFLYIIDAADDASNLEGEVKAGKPIIQLKSNTFLFGAAKNCDVTKDVFLNCKFVDPMEYFNSRG